MGYGVLVLGETGTGKTRLTEALAWAAAALAGPGAVVVLDFSPEALGGFGGRLRAPPGARVYAVEGLEAPRLTSRGCGEAWGKARRNAEKTSRALEMVLEEGVGEVVVVNDASIHGHAGDWGLLLRVLRAARLAVVNSYSGVLLRDECGIWEREERFNRVLAEWADAVLVLGRGGLRARLRPYDGPVALGEEPLHPG